MDFDSGFERPTFLATLKSSDRTKQSVYEDRSEVYPSIILLELRSDWEIWEKYIRLDWVYFEGGTI